MKPEELPMPECEKIAERSEIIDEIIRFVSYLHSKNICLCRFNEESAEYFPIYDDIQETVLKFYDIDPAKVEQERRNLLKILQENAK